MTRRKRSLRPLAGISMLFVGLTLATARAEAERDAIEAAIPLPEPPAVMLAVEALAPPNPPASLAPGEPDIPLPDPPPATILAADPPSEPPAILLPEPDAPTTALAVESEAFAGLLAESLATSLRAPAFARLNKREREALAAFYAQRAYRPIWFENGEALPSVPAMAALLASAAEDGLDPADYPLPGLRQRADAERLPRGEKPCEREKADAGCAFPPSRQGLDTAVMAELALSAAALAYARDARGGRLEPGKLSPLITPELELPDPKVLLAALLETQDRAGLLAGFQPQHRGYQALKARLRELRGATASLPSRPSAALAGRPLRLGDRDPRVPMLRARLDQDPRPDDIYDAALAEAVKLQQRRHRLRATGVFDRRTAESLDAPEGFAPPQIATADLIADIIANMERWRWLPADLGARHLVINLPEFTLRLVEDGQIVHKARVIVGKPETPTPIFSRRMEYAIVNPSWTIPPSIMKNEILPGLARDPSYAAKRGFQVVRRGNTLSVRQPPGERNALGFIKFMFPNPHAVYLHDTPSRGLFAQERRAFSHGCVRLDQPFRLAALLFSDQGYSESRLRAMIGAGERTLMLRAPIPVHLTSFTVFVDENGRLQRRADLYGHDGLVRAALGVEANKSRFARLR